MEDALHEAISAGRADLVSAHLDRRPDDINSYDSVGLTVLHNAVALRHHDAMMVLLDRGAKLDPISGDGEPPLFVAAKVGNTEAVRCLLERGASASDREWIGGQTALHCAAQRGHPDMIPVLFKHGADVEAVDASDQTPMQAAAWTSNAETGASITALICLGADVNARTKKNGTALQAAASEGNIDALNALLDHGANVAELDKRGKSILRDSAMWKGGDFSLRRKVVLTLLQFDLVAPELLL